MEMMDDGKVLLGIGLGVICLGLSYKLYQNARSLEARVMHGEQRITGIEHKLTSIDYRVSALENGLKATQDALGKIYPNVIPSTIAVQPVQQQPSQPVVVQYQQPTYASTRMPL